MESKSSPEKVEKPMIFYITPYAQEYVNMPYSVF